jgi:hypothetical protein
VSDVLARYERAGGRPPADEEWLEIQSDGSFRARRTVGGSRVGSFAGQLPAATIRALERAIAAVADEDDLWTETPRDGATETIDAAGRTAEIGTPRSAKGAWGGLAKRLRDLLERSTDDPLAAVELQASSRAAALVGAGSAPVRLEPASVAVRLVRLDSAGALLGRWDGPAAAPETAIAEPSSLATGERIDLPFEHPLELAPGDWLQVWVTLRLHDDDGARDARLFRAVEAEGG